MAARKYNRDLELARQRSARSMESRRSRDPFNVRLIGSRAQAKRRGLPFDLTLDDIKAIWPVDGICPVLGVKMLPPAYGATFHPNTATLDRIDSSVGYHAGNVWWISWRANDLKSNATLEELLMLVAALRKLK